MARFFICIQKSVFWVGRISPHFQQDFTLEYIVLSHFVRWNCTYSGGNLILLENVYTFKKSCHVTVSGRTYVITIIGRMTPVASMSFDEAVSSVVYLFSGSVTLPDTPAGTVQAVLNCLHSGVALDATPFLATLKQRVLLDDAPEVTCAAAIAHNSGNSPQARTAVLTVRNSISFCDHYCAVVTAEHIYVLDLYKVKLYDLFTFPLYCYAVCTRISIYFALLRKL